MCTCVRKTLILFLAKGIACRSIIPFPSAGSLPPWRRWAKIGKKVLKGVRIVGPVRDHSQVELSRSDALRLGIDTEVRLSGTIQGTPGATVLGPKGRIRLKEGVIIPHRHIHASPAAAKKAGVRNGSIVSVRVAGIRAVTFHRVIVRMHPTYRWHMHIDTDEGNAAGIQRKATGILIKS